MWDTIDKLFKNIDLIDIEKETAELQILLDSVDMSDIDLIDTKESYDNLNHFN